MSWMRFAPKAYTNPHLNLCFGKGGLREHGIKFFTEYRVCGFMVDVYVSPNVVVEVDGPSHLRPRRNEKDKWKNGKLAGHGITVLRYTHDEVQYEKPRIIREILEALK